MSGVRANIPIHDPGSFIGRQQQIATVVDEIIQIPNQHGLIYGPGGVGKTAMLIELSRKIFDGQLQVSPPFRSIIWISAKRDYYDPKLDLVEPEAQQFRSLDQVWTTILEFHEFENADEYPLEDRKWLVLELLRDEKTLLVLDNSETVRRDEQEAIVRFFGVECKKYLRTKPDNCKVLITSREIIPSGFHQIAPKGLDKRDSKLLMAQLFGPYRQSGQKPLTEAQKDQIYEMTQGIPLIIKHCYGQIYEFSRSVEKVLKNLQSAGNQVVDFSFAEVFRILSENETQKAILILLEITNRPLLRRQISDMLALDESAVAARIEDLTRFQCVVRSAFEAEEKYSINTDIRLLATRLVQEHASVAGDIRHRLAHMAAEKRLDYGAEEHDALVVFDGYVAAEQFLQAEDFIKAKLKEQPNSILLNLHYAEFLRDLKRQLPESIERLELIRERSGNHPNVLRLLMETYAALEPPNFEDAFVNARELERNLLEDEDTRMAVANFYAAWSTSLKQKGELDPIKDIMRHQKYKELAEHAIDLLMGCKSERSHNWHYLVARCQFNKWDNEDARLSIERAIAGLPSNSHSHQRYTKLRDDIVRKIYHRRR